MLNRKKLRSSLDKLSPEIIAQASKFETDHRQTLKVDKDGKLEITARQNQAFMTFLKMRADNTRNNESVLNLLTDLELGANVYVSAVVFPETMTTGEFIFSLTTKELAPELASLCTKRVKELFKKNMDLESEIYEIAYNTLIKSGATPMLVIPENALDDLIHGKLNASTKTSMEDFSKELDKFIDHKKGQFKQLGILGPRVKPSNKQAVSMEDSFVTTNYLKKEVDVSDIEPNLIYEGLNDGSDFIDEFVTITDNPNLLRLPKIEAYFRQQKMLECYSKESFGNYNDIEMINALTSGKTNNSNNGFSELKSQKNLMRESIGNPLVTELASESTMVIHSPGNPKDHVGYLILIDENGHPISRYTTSLLLMSFNPTSLNTSLMSGITNRASKAFNGNNEINTIDVLSDQFHNDCLAIYSEIAMRDFLARFRNGVNGNTVEIDNNEAFMSLMLSRSLMRQKTRVLYVPKEYMVYFATDYDHRGMGKAKLDAKGTINTLRSSSLVANTLGGIKNATGITKINVEIPKEDPDGRKTESQIRDLVLKSKAMQLPANGGDYDAITTFLNNSSTKILVKHEDMPSLSMDFSQETNAYPTVDSSLTDELKKLSLASLSLPVEQVDKAQAGDLAIQEVHANQQLARSTAKDRLQLNMHLTKFHRIYIRYSSKFRKNILNLIKANVKKITIKDELITRLYGVTDRKAIDDIKVKYAFNAIVEGITVTLPEPADTTLKDVIAELEEYVDQVKKVIDYKINNDILGDDTGKSYNGKADFFKALMISQAVDQFIADKGILLDVNSMLMLSDQTNEGGAKLASRQIALLAQLSKIIVDVNAADNKGTNDFKDKNVKLSQDGGGSSDYGDDDYGEDDDGFGDDSSIDDDSTGSDDDSSDKKNDDDGFSF